MRNTEWLAGNGLLFKPWLAVAVGIGVLVVIVLGVSMLPWDCRRVVPVTRLPSVRFVTDWDVEWDDTLVLSIDAKGTIWSGTEPVEDLPEELRAFHARSRREWTVDECRVVQVGDVFVRAHRESRWSELRRVIEAIAGAGFPRVTLKCRRAESWGAALELELVLVEVPGPWEPEEPEEPCEPRHQPERIVLRSLDIAAAERARARLSSQRAAMGEAEFVEPIVELAFPASADAQSVFSVLECYVDGSGNTVRVTGLR